MLPVKLKETNITLKMSGMTKAQATLNCLNRFLAAQSFTRETVIIIDDAQYMDSDSYALLNTLIDVRGIAVVVSCCREGTEERGLSELIARSRTLTLKVSFYGVLVCSLRCTLTSPPPPTQSFLPQPFALDETRSLLIDKYDLHDIGKKVLKFCHDRSGANPATLKRLVDSLIANQILSVGDDRILTVNESKIKDTADLEQIETPDSVRAFIRATMAKLSHLSLDLLFLCSTIGRYFSLGVLEDAFKARSASTTLPVKVLKSLVAGGVLAKEKGGGSQSRREDMVFYFRDQTTMSSVYEM